ncbi:unnamed protein product, partial [Pylaiella littoralis]
ARIRSCEDGTNRSYLVQIWEVPERICMVVQQWTGVRTQFCGTLLAVPKVEVDPCERKRAPARNR